MTTETAHDKLIVRARIYAIEVDGHEFNLGEVLAAQNEVIEACDKFFTIAMPKMNVRGSALDAEAILAWNDAETRLARFMAARDLSVVEGSS